MGPPEQTLTAALTWLAAHRKAVAGSALALLAGFGVAAFAVAPMAPDAAALPQRLIDEAIEPVPLAPQLEALAAHRIELSRSDVTRAGDTAAALLQRLGVADGAALTFLRNDPSARRLLEGRGGRSVQARAREDGTLVELVARFPATSAEQIGTHFTRLSITRDAKGWFTATEESAPLQPQVRLASGTIKSSLFAASDAARIPDAIAVQMAEMFAADIDMHRELRRGDTFSVVYEALTADGEPIAWNQGTGRVLAAEFVNGGREYHALWFRGPDGRGAYFDLSGQSKTRTFLASPMEFSRVTSGFAMRLHPIQQTWRKHNGVDYAAPTGTPVRTVGTGVVDFAGWQNGYGNVVEVKHSNDRSTVYAHLSRVDVKKGGRVEQGGRIGAVGSTGWSTGPHLHFEFRINGAHQDPLKIAKASETIALAPSQKVEFQRLAQGLQGQLEVAETLQGARGRAE